MSTSHIEQQLYDMTQIADAALLENKILKKKYADDRRTESIGAIIAIASQPCETWGTHEPGHCLTDETAVNDRCWPCYARNALGLPRKRNDF